MFFVTFLLHFFVSASDDKEDNIEKEKSWAKIRTTKKKVFRCCLKNVENVGNVITPKRRAKENV